MVSGGLPKMRQQTGEGFRVGRRKHCRQAPEHVAKIHKRIVAVPLARGQEAEVDHHAQRGFSSLGS